MDIYYNDKHDSYAVLVSRGFGAGWSTWNQPEIAYDKRVVEWYLKHRSESFCNRVKMNKATYGVDSQEYKDAVKFFESLGYNKPYFGGYRPDMLQWVPCGSAWKIDEYDGAEKLVFDHDIKWTVLD